MASDEYKYKPRLGFDIRIKPTVGARKSRLVEDESRQCEHPEGCKDKGLNRVTKSPDALNEFLWLCAAHAREHNKNWNYFAGKSDTEAAAIREQSRYGDRPTWTMSKNGRASAAARASLGGSRAEIDDALGGATPTSPREDGVYREGRRLTRLQVQAFRTLNLKPSATSSDIKKRYTELLKRFHPDQNGGDRSAESQLQEVIRARQILKKANFI